MTVKITAFIPVIRNQENPEEIGVGAVFQKTDGAKPISQETSRLVDAVIGKVLTELVLIGGYGQLKIEYCFETGLRLNLFNYSVKNLPASRRKRFSRAGKQLDGMRVSRKNTGTAMERVTVTIIVG